ncbi:MAG: class I SAM-dependent methyltransferase [Helicobacter sp.]|nr:class I SAM-dependent methyltransferase [Helicobacter sp.]MDY5740431.1 class I SAM-dependent methyltransferase [Helicobacter sp.]
MQIKPSTTKDGITYFITPPPYLENTQENFTASQTNLTDSLHTDSLNSTTNAESHFPSEGLDMLYLAEQKHFWHISRREFLYKQVTKIFDKLYPQTQGKNLKILDVGAGTGSVTRHFLSQGFSDIAVGEIHPQGLEYAKSYGVKELYCMDLLDVPFQDEFDCIFAFDVLEHIDDDGCALKNMRSMLKNKSILALSVPAHNWLWNAHDCLVHHKRRYTRCMLNKLMREYGFEIVCSRYFFVSITPLLLVRALLAPYDKQNPKLHNSHKPNQLRDIPPPKLINNILLKICRVENKILDLLPQRFSTAFGGSLLVIAMS